MKKTILFVDDEEINLFVLSRRFETEYTVLTANNVQDAIDIITTNNGPVHALISDLKMPEMSGLQMIDQCKEQLNGVPCFLLTGYDTNPEIEEAISSNKIRQLFKKPFNYNEISNALKDSLH